MCERPLCKCRRLCRRRRWERAKRLEVCEGKVVGQCNMRHEGDRAENNGFGLKESSSGGVVRALGGVVRLRIRFCR